MSDTVVEPYNATLSVHQLVENADECVVGNLCPSAAATAPLLPPPPPRCCPRRGSLHCYCTAFRDSQAMHWLCNWGNVSVYLPLTGIRATSVCSMALSFRPAQVMLML